MSTTEPCDKPIDDIKSEWEALDQRTRDAQHKIDQFKGFTEYKKNMTRDEQVALGEQCACWKAQADFWRDLNNVRGPKREEIEQNLGVDIAMKVDTAFWNMFCLNSRLIDGIVSEWETLNVRTHGAQDELEKLKRSTEGGKEMSWDEQVARERVRTCWEKQVEFWHGLNSKQGMLRQEIEERLNLEIGVKLKMAICILLISASECEPKAGSSSNDGIRSNDIGSGSSGNNATNCENITGGASRKRRRGCCTIQ